MISLFVFHHSNKYLLLIFFSWSVTTCRHVFSATVLLLFRMHVNFLFKKQADDGGGRAGSNAGRARAPSSCARRLSGGAGAKAAPEAAPGLLLSNTCGAAASWAAELRRCGRGERVAS